MWIWMLVIAAIIVVDQTTKILVMSFMELGESIPVIKGVFNFTYILNDGMAFGLLDSQRWLFMLVSTLALIALIYYMLKSKPESRWACAGLSLVIGGGLGNMIDRMFYGESFGDGAVVDFIDFCAFPELWKWIFNVADSCVCVGAAILMGYLVIEIVKESKAEKLAAESAENAEDNGSEE